MAFGAGAQGTNYLGIPTKMLADLLSSRNKYRQDNRDDAEFESMLGTSGLSTADQEMARFLRKSPSVARVMEQSQQRDADRQQREDLQRQREQAQADVLKQRQDYADEVRKSKSDQTMAQMLSRKEGLESTPASVSIPAMYAPGGAPAPSPVANAATQGIDVASRMFGLPMPSGVSQQMGQQAASNVGMNNVNVAPIDKASLDWYAKNFPGSSFLKQAMDQNKVIEIQRQQAVDHQKMMKDFLTKKAKKDEKDAQIEDVKRRSALARAALGDDAKPEEIARFDAWQQSEDPAKFNPAQVAEKIIGDRKKKSNADDKANRAAQDKAVNGKFTNDEQIEIKQAQIEAEKKAQAASDSFAGRSPDEMAKNPGAVPPPKPSQAGKAAREAKELEIRQRRAKGAAQTETETQPATAKPEVDVQAKKDWDAVASAKDKPSALAALKNFYNNHKGKLTPSDIAQIAEMKKKIESSPDSLGGGSGYDKFDDMVGPGEGGLWQKPKDGLEEQTGDKLSVDAIRGGIGG